ncbi:hypothetical protein [Hyphomonas johnsonii]|uniref:Lipoprotein n=1 Tax=Hyphomonas johnsonii MHS-2 TaxID=1280950 RepID=A0A059FV56_9PROT|nr:hypothetical protein [Hyphomonas johnsonii]KCZ94529.1 hypothetical protein HJO_04105 [Hyphomonas johnsonii MHS-2]
MRQFLVPILVIMASGSAAAQQEAPAPVPCSGEAYHAFDFWVGTWDVYDGSGNKVGENTILPEEGGCVLVERWTSTSGTTGQSYNFLEPDSGKWRQVWVSKGSVIDYAGGLSPEGSMKLEGRILYHASGQSAPFTGEWTPNEDGSVTQHFEQYNAATDTWDPWFTGKYVRKAPE